MTAKMLTNIVLLFCLIYFKITRSQTCYGVNGDTTNFQPSILEFTLSSTAYCPNSPNTRCVYLSNTATVYAIYDMSLYKNLTFKIDYELDEQYSSNDYTRIYYNCGFGNTLGLSIQTSSNNAVKDNAYQGTSFSLPSICNHNPNVNITISQYQSTTTTIYFNFENVCLGPNPVYPYTKKSATSSSASTSVSVCFYEVSICESPTITVDYIPIDYDDANEYIKVTYSGVTYDCANDVPQICRSINQCGPFVLSNLWNINSDRCVKLDIGSEVDSLCSQYAYGTLNANVTLSCGNTHSPTLSNDPASAPTKTPIMISSNKQVTAYDGMTVATNWVRSSESQTVQVYGDDDVCADTYGTSIPCCAYYTWAACMRLPAGQYMYREFSVSSSNYYCLSVYIVTDNIFECDEYVTISYKCSAPSSSTDFSNITQIYGSEVDAGFIYIKIPCAYTDTIAIRFSTSSSFEKIFIDELNIYINDNTCQQILFPTSLIGTPNIGGEYAAYDDMVCAIDNDWAITGTTAYSTNSNYCISPKCVSLYNGGMQKTFLTTTYFSGPYCLQFHARFDDFESSEYYRLQYSCNGGSWISLATIYGISNSDSGYYGYNIPCNSYSIIGIYIYIYSNGDKIYIDDMSIISSDTACIASDQSVSPSPSPEDNNTTKKNEDNFPPWLIGVLVSIGVIVFLYIRRNCCSTSKPAPVNNNNVSNVIINNTTTTRTTAPTWKSNTNGETTTNITTNNNNTFGAPTWNSNKNDINTFETELAKPFTFGLDLNNNNTNIDGDDFKMDIDISAKSENSWDNEGNNNNNDNSYNYNDNVSVSFEPEYKTNTNNNDNNNNNNNNTDMFKPSAPAPPSYDDVVANPDVYEVEGTPPPGYAGY